MPSHTSVVEYFVARDEVLAFVISKNGLVVRRHLCTLNRLQHLHERFRLQIEKFQFGPKYVQEFKRQLQESMDRHLQELYTELILPLEEDLRSPHLIIVPHGVLHYLPFHAFFDGEQYLIDRHTISYAPSASVLKFCMRREPVESCKPVIAGVADDRAPLIANEIAKLQEIVPDARMYFGEVATKSAIREAVDRGRLRSCRDTRVFSNRQSDAFSLQALGWLDDGTRPVFHQVPDQSSDIERLQVWSWRSSGRRRIARVDARLSLCRRSFSSAKPVGRQRPGHVYVHGSLLRTVAKRCYKGRSGAGGGAMCSGITPASLSLGSI